MDAIRNRPLFTEMFDSPGAFRPSERSAYVYGVLEERSEHVDAWRATAQDVTLVKVQERDNPTIVTDLTGAEQLSLRRRDHLERLFGNLDVETIYVDITGLSHHVWAPMVRFALEKHRRVKVVYVEPADYKYSGNPMRGEIFDLSEKINGISPIPLFASLNEPGENVCFIPLLGFEGARFAFMIEEVDPPGGNIVPVIGVPGFRAEYPFHAYQGNEPTLSKTRAWRQVRYARANCPFSLFYVLEDILHAYPTDYIKIAPIGTKPHALGAVLKCLASRRPIELVYDHPKRKQKRTSGAHHCLVYSVSDFLSGNPLNENSGLA